MDCLTLAGLIVGPGLVAFLVLSFMPSVTAPLGHAMRGDSPLASGVLAVLTLVGAAALAAKSFGSSSRSPGMVVATVGAVLLGIVMIIVTFSASETAELEVPPAAGTIVPFLAPLIPLGLGIAALQRARSVWHSRFPDERSEGRRFAVARELASSWCCSSSVLSAPCAPPRVRPVPRRHRRRRRRAQRPDL